jgi:hypothetical protein
MDDRTPAAGWELFAFNPCKGHRHWIPSAGDVPTDFSAPTNSEILLVTGGGEGKITISR